MTKLEDLIAAHDWRYLPRGRVTHALLTPSAGVVARCGRAAWSADQWHGTGSQVEYERAGALPRCADCVRALADIVEAMSRAVEREYRC